MEEFQDLESFLDRMAALIADPEPSVEDGWFTTRMIADHTGDNRSSVRNNLKRAVDAGVLEFTEWRGNYYYREVQTEEGQADAEQKEDETTAG